MPRSLFKFDVRPGGCWNGKVRRYLRAAGLDAPAFLTDEMRQRHVHPRHRRQMHVVAPVPVTAPSTPVSPFALLGKKPSAPAS